MNKYLVAVCRHKEFPHILTVWAYSFEDAKEKFLEQVYMTEAKYDRLVAVLTKKKNIG